MLGTVTRIRQANLYQDLERGGPHNGGDNVLSKMKKGGTLETSHTLLDRFNMVFLLD